MPILVLGVDESAPGARVHDGDGEVVGDFDDLQAEVAAVDERCPTGFGRRRGQLVHHTRRKTEHLVLDPLADLGEWARVRDGGHPCEKGVACGDFECGRR